MASSHELEERRALIGQAWVTALSLGLEFGVQVPEKHVDSRWGRKLRENRGAVRRGGAAHAWQGPWAVAGSPSPPGRCAPSSGLGTDTRFFPTRGARVRYPGSFGGVEVVRAVPVGQVPGVPRGGGPGVLAGASREVSVSKKGSM